MVFNPVKDKKAGFFPKTIISKRIFPRIRAVFVHFLNILQETDNFLEQLIFDSSAIDEIRRKTRLSLNFLSLSDQTIHTFERPFERPCSDKCFSYTYFSQFSVLDSFAVIQIKLESLFLRKFLGLTINLPETLLIKVVLETFQTVLLNKKDFLSWWNIKIFIEETLC